MALRSETIFVVLWSRQICGRILEWPVPLTVGSSVDRPLSSLQIGCSKNMHGREKVGVSPKLCFLGGGAYERPANEKSSRTRSLLVAESWGGTP